MKSLKKFVALLTAVGLCLSAPVTSQAAAKKVETRTPITSVSVKVESEVEAETDVSESTVRVTSNSENYTIGGYQWVGAKESWEIGDVPKVKIEIHARSGYFFDKTTGTKKFQIEGAEYSSVRKTNNSETLELTVKLSPARGELGETDNAEWVGYPIGKATWEAVPYAGAYELKLYRDGQMVYAVEKVTTNSYDFLPYMIEGGNYEFRVRAIPKNTDEEKYVKSGEWVYSGEDGIDEEDTSPFYGKNTNGPGDEKLTPEKTGWRLNDDQEWYYIRRDGTRPTNDWMSIDGSWYLFDSEGYMLKGWQTKNGKYYFMNNNGQMQTGWLDVNKQRYYLGTDGAMQKGWIFVNNQWFFMDDEGKMQREWLLNNGRWYYLNPDDGSMMTNVSIGGYYINHDGIWSN